MALVKVKRLPKGSLIDMSLLPLLFLTWKRMGFYATSFWRDRIPLSSACTWIKRAFAFDCFVC